MMQTRQGLVATETDTSRPPSSLRAQQAIWLVTGIVDAVVVIRFGFELLGASSRAGFVRFIYDITRALVLPFHGIFGTAASGQYVFEPESLVAIAIYSLIGWGLASLVRVLFQRGMSGQH